MAELKSLNPEGTWSDNVYTNANVTYTCTVENGYVTKISLSGTTNATNQLRIKDRNRKDYVLEKGTYVLNGCPVSGSTNSYYITASKNKVWDNPSSGFDALGNDVGSGFTYTLSEHAQLGISIQIANGINTSGLEFKPMISFDGGEYAPYAMTNKELTDNKVDKNVRTLSSSDDLDNITEVGFYSASTSLTNAPESASYFNMIVMVAPESGVIRQVIFSASGAGTCMYIRTKSGEWKSWVKFTGTVVS